MSENKYVLPMKGAAVEQALSGFLDISKKISRFKITEGSDGAFRMDIKFEDGAYDTFSVPAGDKPDSIVYNGATIPIEWAVSE